MISDPKQSRLRGSQAIFGENLRARPVVNPDSRTITFAYDPVGNRTSMADATGLTTSTYDALNRQKTVQNALGQVTTTSYDADGQMSSVENPIGYRTTYVYDALHRRTAVWDAENRRTTTVYDSANRAITEQNSLNFRTTFQHDVAGRREALIDANGSRTTYQYDPAGNVTSEIEPLGRRTTFTYTALNQLESKLDARNVRTTYIYDALGHSTERRFSDSTPTVTYEYDAVGNRTQMSDASGVTTYTYDALDRQLTRFNSVDATRLTQSYDPVGNRLTLDVNEGRFTYVYDPLNRATQITNPFADRVTIAFDALGRTQQEDVSGGLRRIYTMDSAGRVQSVLNRKLPSTDLANYDYQYDRVGNPLQVADLVTTNVTTFAYDAAHRLVNERASGVLAYNITHTYDPVGNRLFEDSGTQRGTFTYDAANQLVTAVFPSGVSPTHQYTYDGAGNLITDFYTTSSANTLYYTWSAENLLIKAESDRQDTYEHKYNGDGLRSSKTDDGGTPLRFVWDGQNLVREPQGSVVYLNTYNPQVYGHLLGRRRATTTIRWFGYDAQGTVTQILDGNGALLTSNRFSAYGKPLSGGFSQVAWIGRLGYSRDDDDYNNYYVRARWYTPVTARWLSRDPLGYEANPWNLYDYSWQNPTTWTDPSGLHPSMAGCFSFNPFSIFTRSVEDVVNDCGLSTSEERRMFQHWTGNSGSPYKIPDNDVCYMGRNSPVLSAELNRLRNACLSGRPLPDPPPGGFPAPPPYQGGIGGGRYEIRSTCNNGCFCYELIITDVYDFDWKFFKRSLSNELKTMAVSCTISGTDYDVIGTCRDCFGPGCSPRLGPQPIPF